MITQNDISVLVVLASYYVLCRPQIQRLCFGSHFSGRGTRKRLAKLLREGLIHKHRTFIPFGGSSTGCPVYWLSRQGAELLCSYFDDETYLACNTRRPRADLLFHWLAIGETHIAIEHAVSADPTVELVAWINEWETVNKTDSFSQHFYLHTVLSESPPLSCSPDAGFVLDVAGHRKVFYLEQDRNTGAAKSVAARKAPGFAELASRGLHLRHFPCATVDTFTVLAVTTDRGRRNRLASAIEGRPGANLWLFVSQDELTPERLLYDPITYNSKREAGPLLSRPVDQSEETDETPRE